MNGKKSKNWEEYKELKGIQGYFQRTGGVFKIIQWNSKEDNGIKNNAIEFERIQWNSKDQLNSVEFNRIRKNYKFGKQLKRFKEF